MTGTMDRDAVWAAIDAERAGLADLLDDLTEAEWARPSLCAGWRVGDVAAHLSLAHMTVGAALAGTVRARGDVDRMIRDTALRQAATIPRAQVAGTIRGMVGSRRRAPGVTHL